MLASIFSLRGGLFGIGRSYGSTCWLGLATIVGNTFSLPGRIKGFSEGGACNSIPCFHITSFSFDKTDAKPNKGYRRLLYMNGNHNSKKLLLSTAERGASPTWVASATEHPIFSAFLVFFFAHQETRSCDTEMCTFPSKRRELPIGIESVGHIC